MLLAGAAGDPLEVFTAWQGRLRQSSQSQPTATVPHCLTPTAPHCHGGVEGAPLAP